MNATWMQRALVAGVVVAGLGMGTLCGLAVRHYRGVGEPTAIAERGTEGGAAQDGSAVEGWTPEMEEADVRVLAEATFLVEEGRFADAVRVLEKYTRVYPLNAHGWMWYGHALRGMGSLREAIEAYDRALVLDDSRDEARLARAETCLDRADALWQAGDRDAAELQYAMAHSGGRAVRGRDAGSGAAALVLARAVEGMSRNAAEAVAGGRLTQPMAASVRGELDALLEEGIYAARTAAAQDMEDAGARTLAASLLLRRAHFHESWGHRAEAMEALSESLHAYRSALQLVPMDPDVRRQAQSAERLMHAWVERGGGME